MNPQNGSTHDGDHLPRRRNLPTKSSKPEEATSESVTPEKSEYDRGESGKPTRALYDPKAPRNNVWSSHHSSRTHTATIPPRKQAGVAPSQLIRSYSILQRHDETKDEPLKIKTPPKNDQLETKTPTENNITASSKQSSAPSVPPPPPKTFPYAAKKDKSKDTIEKRVRRYCGQALNILQAIHDRSPTYELQKNKGEHLKYYINNMCHIKPSTRKKLLSLIEILKDIEERNLYQTIPVDETFKKQAQEHLPIIYDYIMKMNMTDIPGYNNFIAQGKSYAIAAGSVPASSENPQEKSQSPATPLLRL